MLQNEEDISLFTVVQRDTLPDIEPFVITRLLVLSKMSLLETIAANHLSALSCIGEVLNLELFKKLMGVLCNSKISTERTQMKNICHILDTK